MRDLQLTGCHAFYHHCLSPVPNCTSGLCLPACIEGHWSGAAQMDITLLRLHEIVQTQYPHFHPKPDLWAQKTPSNYVKITHRVQQRTDLFTLVVRVIYRSTLRGPCGVWRKQKYPQQFLSSGPRHLQGCTLHATATHSCSRPAHRNSASLSLSLCLSIMCISLSLSLSLCGCLSRPCGSLMDLY